MTGRGDPPEGTPSGVPGSGDDEFRSVVFDESFVNAARLEEYSAKERMGDHTPAVRRRRTGVGGASKQAVLLVLLIAVAFGTAIYMGVRHPYQQPSGHVDAEPLRAEVVPLSPSSPVPGGYAFNLLEQSPARDFRQGADGVVLPAPRRTGAFSAEQVRAALVTAKEYVVNSSITPRTLTGGDTRAVRLELAPDLLRQYDQSLRRPLPDGRHSATGWMVRFDPHHVALAARGVRVDGTVTYEEVSSQEIEVTADHTLVYALRPAEGVTATDEKAEKAARRTASLFTVHRVVRMRFDREDLRQHQLRPVESWMSAGPLPCAKDTAAYLQPLLAGERDHTRSGGGTDPYAHAGERGSGLCAGLAASSQPRPTPQHAKPAEPSS